jgi:hypothetical protein
VPDDGLCEPKHLALCDMKKCCAERHIFVNDTGKYNGMHQNKTDHDLETHVSYTFLYTSNPTKQAYCME